MEMGYACLAEQLHRMGFLSTSQCTVCDQDYVLIKSHLGKCKGLQEDNSPGLYWEPKRKKMQMNPYAFGKKQQQLMM